MSSHSLEELKEIKYQGVKELTEAVNRFLESLNSENEEREGKNSRFVSQLEERTVRHYLAGRLIAPAREKRGWHSIFSYEHLLTLLVIKKLQVHKLPISVIRTLITGKSVEELEKLFGEEVHTFTSERELEDYRRSIGHTDDSEVRRFSLPMAAALPPEPPKKNAAKKYLESLLLDPRRREEPEPPQPAAAPSLPPGPAGTSDWRRYEIVPGVELHISRSFRPPQDKGFRNRLLVLIDGILQSRERRQK